MFRKAWIPLMMMLALALVACAPAKASPTPEANMPNPASVYCEEQGGTVEMRQDAAGNTTGVCVFPDGSECDEWAFYRGECAPADQAPAANMPNPASVFCEGQGGTVEMHQDAEGNQYGMCVFPDGSECDEWAYFRGECAPGGDTETGAVEEPEVRIEMAEDGCQLYSNEKLGYSFHFPADATVINNEEPLKSISIIGPVVDGESWPSFTISHPSDREDYQPPVDVNLEQWLADHNLVGETRLEDVQIAGVTAIHFRHDRSPQSYAYDRYYFAVRGQLYMIVIGHTGDKEDWELYNHFLESFQF